MELLHQTLEIVVLLISGLGAIVVIWGVIEGIKAFVSMKVTPGDKDAVSASEAIRQRLGAHLLLGLEIFIAADIISSVVSPSWEKVGILAAIVGIRTVLSCDRNIVESVMEGAAVISSFEGIDRCFMPAMER